MISSSFNHHQTMAGFKWQQDALESVFSSLTLWSLSPEQKPA